MKEQQEERTATLFSRCYDYLENNRDVINRIMKNNPEDGRFTESMRKALRETIYQIIVSCPCAVKYKLPYDMISQHYERLKLMHDMFHMGDPEDKFRFDWKWLVESGLSVKDFIAPSGLSDCVFIQPFKQLFILPFF